MVGQTFAERSIAVVNDFGTSGTVSTSTPERGKASAATEEADQPGKKYDQWEGNVENENRDKRQPGKTTHDIVLQSARPNPHHSLKHHCQHGGFQTKEQPLYNRHLAEQNVDIAKRQNRQEAGQHKQRTGNQPALGLVEQPANIDCQLLRLGARQEHAIVQRMQKALLTNPALFLDKYAMHHRNLSRRTAKRECRYPRPDLDRITKRNAVALRLNPVVGNCGSRVLTAHFAGFLLAR